MNWLPTFSILRRLAPRDPPADRKAREVIATRYRQLAFGPITETTRAEDRQRLADAAAGKGKLI